MPRVGEELTPAASLSSQVFSHNPRSRILWLTKQSDPEPDRADWNVETNDKAFEIPGFAWERLRKAEGHFNAAKRKLWDDVDRSLWSAGQAKARLAETWLWIKEGAEFPPLDRYLARGVTEERLQAFSRAPMSDAIKTAWVKLEAAERAILKDGFPRSATSRTDEKQEEEALGAGVARKDRYLRALRDFKRTVEDAVVERYVDLRSGDWVAVKQGPTGRVLGLAGLRLRIFPVADKSEGVDRFHHVTFDEVENGIRHFTLLYARITRLARPEHSSIMEPSYYWMRSAHDCLRMVSHSSRSTDENALSGIDWMLTEALDSAAKAWWASFAPDDEHVIWDRQLAQHVEHLAGRAPLSVSAPLRRCMRNLRALGKNRDDAPRAGPASWRPAVAAMSALVETALRALEPLIEPRIDVAVGDWLSTTCGDGRVVARQGTSLAVDVGRPRPKKRASSATIFSGSVHPSMSGGTRTGCADMPVGIRAITWKRGFSGTPSPLPTARTPVASKAMPVMHRNPRPTN